jgi:hypothetical protein
LFEEIARVLKSGGAFEVRISLSSGFTWNMELMNIGLQLIEEDLFFPGKKSGDDDDSDSDTMSELRYAHNDSDEDDESVITGSGGGSGGSRKSYDGSAPTSDTSLGASFTPPRTASPLPMIGASIQEEIEEVAEGPSKPPPKKSLPTAHPSHRHSYQQRIPSTGGRPRPPPSASTTSLLGLGPAVVPPPMVERKAKPRGYSTSMLVTPNHHPSVLSLQSGNHSPMSGSGMAKPAVSPFLLRTLPKAPPNPRDHSLLEGIYNEMNATRFINLSPLSLLANLVGLHFKGFVFRLNPQLLLMFFY